MHRRRLGTSSLRLGEARLVATGSSKISEDETSITVEPPLSKPTDNQENPDEEESITEVVDTNLPSSGISAIMLSTCLALFYINNNRKNS